MAVSLRFGKCPLLLRFCVSIMVLLGSREAPAQQHEVLVQRDSEVRMRDGTFLKADVYSPTDKGSYPVLLQRTPYDKRDQVDFALKAAARGYVVVIQDVRGRFSSDGEWYPFKHESQDGYDSVEWAAALPFSNGKVGMFGASYVGATQLLAAVSRPPHLAGLCPMETASDYYEGWTYEGGALQQWFDETWTSNLSRDTLVRTVREDSNPIELSRLLPLSTYTPLRIRTSDDFARKSTPYFFDWLSHPTYDDYWKQWSIQERYEQIQVPVLTVAAWYDIFLGGSLRNYIGLETKAGTKAARETQRLIIAIGGHAGQGRKIGDFDFGAEAADFDERQITLEWYDYLLRGIENRFSKQKRVRIFVMGANQWREEDEWPPARAKRTRYYLHSSGGANSLAGNGELSLQVPTTEKPDQYTYDPLDPVATIGGPLCCNNRDLAGGPRDQRRVEARNDVLVYTTSALRENLEVTGPVSVDLYVSSSAVDTDFTAKLVDVWPDGLVQNLSDGVVRGRYRDSRTSSTPLTPGEVYQLTIDLHSTSNVFQKGHRIRLEISSSNFPRFDRNLNSQHSASESAVVTKAQNTILHDRQHPSALLLSIIPVEDGRR